MMLRIFTPNGVVPAVVDDDASDEEIRRVIDIALNIKQSSKGKVEYIDGN